MNLASDACVRVRRHFFWVPDSLDRASSSTKLPRLGKRAFQSAGHPAAAVEIVSYGDQAAAASWLVWEAAVDESGSKAQINNILSQPWCVPNPGRRKVCYESAL